MPLKFIDFLKFFFCLCVVIIHCESLAGINSNVEFFITQGLLRLAVPFFFVASGYFLGKKVKETPEKIDSIFIKYIRRLLVPLVFFSLINIALETIKMSFYMNGPMIFREIIKHIVFYPWGALWFVQACVVGACFLYPFAKKNNLEKAILIAVMLYSWALLCNNYFFVVQGTFFEPYIHVFMNLCVSARNGIFVGFVYMAIGLFVAKKNVRIPHFCIIVSFAVYLLEIFLIRNKASLDDSALYISQLLVVPIIFIKSSSFTLNISDAASLIFRKFSVGVYLLHRPVISVLDIIGANNIPRTFVVILVCVGISYLVYKENWKMKKILF